MEDIIRRGVHAIFGPKLSRIIGVAIIFTVSVGGTAWAGYHAYHYGPCRYSMCVDGSCSTPICICSTRTTQSECLETKWAWEKGTKADASKIGVSGDTLKPVILDDDHCGDYLFYPSQCTWNSETGECECPPYWPEGWVHMGPGNFMGKIVDCVSCDNK
jgi:hypothetical protein